MENIIDNYIPFLTRFFRAWADDLDLSDTDFSVNADGIKETDGDGTR